MLRPIKNARELGVDVCERGTGVCDGDCRRALARERVLLDAWRLGARV
jgi:hypothetical protein